MTTGRPGSELPIYDSKEEKKKTFLYFLKSFLQQQTAHAVKAAASVINSLSF